MRQISAEPPTTQDAQAREAESLDTLRDILTLVRVRTGHDFSSYKRATLFRRIARRMQVCECANLEAYHRFLRERPHELPHLLRDFLISVTNFFRDPEAFQALATETIPRMFQDKAAGDQVRVWVTGCATGEEAYSLGMLLLEHAATQRAVPAIQIFATDIDEPALAEARAGLYPLAIENDVSPERLARFFTRENDHYRVTKELREIILFSPHNVLRDPPFSRLDLVSCRNLLIYLNREAQTRVLSMFHFALRAEGRLLLGSSESAEGTSLFGVVDAKYRIFVRQGVPTVAMDTAIAAGHWQPSQPVIATYAPRQRPTSIRDLHYRLVEYYAPPSVLLNADLDIMHLSEHAGRYFALGGGEPTRQALALVIAPLRSDLRTAIYAARQAGSDRRQVRYEDEGVVRTIELHVRTVDMPELGRGAMLVTFDDTVTARGEPTDTAPGAGMEPVVRQIEEELHRTRDQLRTTVEQYETSLEELKASNEELQAINEELRSATEELETSKEELQSVNEELTTLNHELKIKIDEISHANSDLQNLMMSTEIGVIFLDRSLNIKRFTPRVQDVFNIIPSDIGRPLAHVTHRLQDDDLTTTAQSVLQTLRTTDKEVPTRDGRSFLMRWLPYRSIEDRIDGVVLTLIDVSDLRQAVEARRRSEAALQLVEERLRVAMRIAPVAALSFDPKGDLTWAYVLGRELGAVQLDLLNIFARNDADALSRAVAEVLSERRGRRLELVVRTPDGNRTFDFRLEPSPTGVTVVGFDVTASKAAERHLRDADRRKDEFLATLSHELRNPLAPLKIALDVARLVGDDPEQRSQSLSVMERQVGMLSQLVDELLDLSRITQGKLQLDIIHVDIGHVLERAIEATQPLIDVGEHELKVSLPNQPVLVAADVRRLVQVFTNLLTNAAKYTPHGGKIDVGVTLDASSNRVAVRIADNGIGIAPDALTHIFDIFVQSRDAEGRAQGGLGIGLNVVRRLVELHGGLVMAASDGQGAGSAFTVQMPIIKA